MTRKLIAGGILLLSLITAGCQGKEETLILASKPMTEQIILSEILTLLIEDRTDLKVEQKQAMAGGTATIHPGLVEGSIDLAPEYTGTGWLFVLKETLIRDRDQLYEAVKEGYEKEYQIRWTGRYGFNNTYRLAVTKEAAEKYGLQTMSDLAAASPSLTFISNGDFFEREDGYKGLVKEYGLAFGKTEEVDIGLRYEAVRSGKADVIVVFTTDGQLEEAGLVILEDDKDYFPYYDAATLVREAVLEEHPELEDVLNLLAGKIQDEDMVHMNYLVEIRKEDPAKVAQDFLKAQGLLQ